MYHIYLRTLFVLFISSLIICKHHSNSKKSTKSKEISLTKTRILSEWRDINRDHLTLKNPFNITSTEDCDIRLSPIENNFLQWHFSFTGVSDSPFEGGCYHGKIVLSPEYPRKAPSICVLTPNGRWEVGKEICLSGIKECILHHMNDDN